MMGINITVHVKEGILRRTQAIWCNKIKYLGIMVLNTDDPKEWLDSNLSPMINQTINQLKEWGKLKLSWFGHIAALKLKMLPSFLYLFQNLSVSIPQAMLQDIKRLFDHFIWQGKKARIGALVLQLPKGQEGVTASNIWLYYHATNLYKILQWWKVIKI